MRQQYNATFVSTGNPLLKAHLGDVAGRKRVGLVYSSESTAQWHHNQRIRLIKDGHLPQERGKET